MTAVMSSESAAALGMNPEGSLALLGDRLRFMGAQLRPGVCAVMLGVYPPQLSEMGLIYGDDPHIPTTGAWLQRQGGRRANTSMVTLLEANLPVSLDPRTQTSRLIGLRLITRMPGGRLVTPSQYGQDRHSPEEQVAMYGKWHGYLDAIQRGARERELRQIPRRHI
ncbi:MAG TPA: hypothetical protein VGS28_02835 [Candidatus Saccharimonadales bacterium]|nr:hypothetical protein [Candidatus Saccharimonadales bacterium]